MADLNTALVLAKKYKSLLDRNGINTRLRLSHFFGQAYAESNLDVKAENLNKTVDLYLQLISKMDKNIIYKNLQPNCEVMLSKHDLYPKTGGAILPNSTLSALDLILWSLFYMDGKTTLYEIAKKLDVDLEVLYKEAFKIEEKSIIERINV